MKVYIGITIGPIVETICETTKPAGLWFASIIFSDISRRLCRKIHESGAEILSPYYDGNDSFADGVGKYHDRIIYSRNAESCSDAEMDNLETDLKNIIRGVKADTAVCFLEAGADKDPKPDMAVAGFLQDYLQIKYVILTEEEINAVGQGSDKNNSLLAISPYLDAIELMKTFPKNVESNPFVNIFSDGTGTDNKRSNEKIKNSRLFKEIVESNQFFESENGDGKMKKVIRGLGSIARGDMKKNVGVYTSYKILDYFAVVSADGDGMGKFLCRLKDDKQVQAFSKACLEYVKKASEKIGEFGGMTIYGGGDDLLFLAPLICGEKNILTLCTEINKTFRNEVREAFSEQDVDQSLIPTISFGVAVRYNKYPLYEALEKSRQYLSYVKDESTWKGIEKKKDAIAFQIEKHSGQSMGVIIPNETVDTLCNQGLFELLLAEEKKDSELSKSVIYTLELMKNALDVLEAEQLDVNVYWNIWKNFFDNPLQKKNEDEIKKLCEWYYKNLRSLTRESDVRAIMPLAPEMMENAGEGLSLFTMLLRIAKFFAEEKDERKKEKASERRKGDA